MSNNKSYSGLYTIRNPSKYRGDPNNIRWRSLWERKLCEYFDFNPSVISWSLEPFPIPYLNPLDRKYHRYFVDFWVKIKDKNGIISERLIEVKPYYQTVEPKKPDKINKKYAYDMQNWIINNSKWEAAKKLCEQKDWKFTVITEKTIFGKKNDQ